MPLMDFSQWSLGSLISSNLNADLYCPSALNFCICVSFQVNAESLKFRGVSVSVHGNTVTFFPWAISSARIIL